ncbi:MAG: DEAD/DEAH box helicase family protein [Nodosilinea sp.]
MSLKDLTIQDEYRSSECNIVKDFYIPCLEQATVYNRAVGYFSSSSMACVAQGLTAFVRSGGQMRLITSPQLSEEDVQAIEQGLKNREQTIEAALLRELEAELPQVIQDRLAVLAWLLSNGLLEIKLAIPKTLRQRGIYHEKLGVFVDREGHMVAFAGSANESASALIDNFECLDVYCSWDEGVNQRALQKAKHFQDLWNNQTKHVEVMAFPEAVARSLLQWCPPQAPTQDPRVSAMHERYETDTPPPEASKQGVPITPFWLNLRLYQKQAVENWFKNNGRGTLKMATGSGKTITALAIAAALYDKIQLEALIVVCPYRHLVQQWDRECRKFGLEPVLAYESVKKWQSNLSNQLINLRLGLQPFVTIITTNATLMSAGFQSQLEAFPKKTLLIGDEARNLGAERLAASLPREVMTRLTQVQDNYSVWFRAQLEKRIQEVFSRISITPYTPRLNDKYELTLEDNTTGRPTPVAASQGENQILSLSFIGAIVDKVREWSQDRHSSLFMGPESDVFPLVMDSPFGALDSVHRRQVARSLPQLANQLVVLVSKTQWRDEVEKEMDELIGRMYVLSYHSLKEDVEQDEIFLKGEHYPLVRRSVNEYEWTEVVEVSQH